MAASDGAAGPCADGQPQWVDARPSFASSSRSEASKLVGRRVARQFLVDSTASEWFLGSVTGVEDEERVQITYDDGDTSVERVSDAAILVKNFEDGVHLSGGGLVEKMLAASAFAGGGVSDDGDAQGLKRPRRPSEDQIPSPPPPSPKVAKPEAGAQPAAAGDAKPGTCTYKGVTVDNRKGKPVFSATYKQRYVGCFSSAEDAARAFDRAARKDGCLCVNFPTPGTEETQAVKQPWARGRPKSKPFFKKPRVVVPQTEERAGDAAMESSARCDVPDIPYVGIERGHNFRGWKAVYQGKVQDGLPRRKYIGAFPTAREAAQACDDYMRSQGLTAMNFPRPGTNETQRVKLRPFGAKVTGSNVAQSADDGGRAGAAAAGGGGGGRWAAPSGPASAPAGEAGAQAAGAGGSAMAALADVAVATAAAEAATRTACTPSQEDAAAQARAQPQQPRASGATVPPAPPAAAAASSSGQPAAPDALSQFLSAHLADPAVRPRVPELAEALRKGGVGTPEELTFWAGTVPSAAEDRKAQLDEVLFILSGAGATSQRFLATILRVVVEKVKAAAGASAP